MGNNFTFLNEKLSYEFIYGIHIDPKPSQVISAFTHANLTSNPKAFQSYKPQKNTFLPKISFSWV